MIALFYVSSTFEIKLILKNLFANYVLFISHDYDFKIVKSLEQNIN